MRTRRSRRRTGGSSCRMWNRSGRCAHHGHDLSWALWRFQVVSHNGSNNGGIAPLPAGGASSALDLAGTDRQSELDRGAVRTAARDWPKRFAKITPERKARWLDDLDKCRDVTLGQIMDADPVEGVKAMTSIVKTELAMELANQKDEHAAAGVNATTVNVQNNTVIRVTHDRLG